MDDNNTAHDDTWLDTLQIHCTDLSVNPFTARQVLERIRDKTNQVTLYYLPCVEFLVSCQQELRASLHKTPKSFYSQSLRPLPTRFLRLNRGRLRRRNGKDKHKNGEIALQDAVRHINQLVQQALEVQSQGTEMMKTTFLGGMKDGESWGLRKWLAKHGAALGICNDLECLLRSCQNLDRDLATTRSLGDSLRPLAETALRTLRREVPTSYQEISTAHPYLPFFHRLEAALKGMAGFDPEDDDVILVEDDEEIELAKQKAKEKTQNRADRDNNITSVHETKRNQSQLLLSLPESKRRRQRQREQNDSQKDSLEKDMDDNRDDHDHSDDSDSDSDVEVLEVLPGNTFLDAPEDEDEDEDEDEEQTSEDSNTISPFDPSPQSEHDWRCRRCKMLNAAEINRCCMCDEGRDDNTSSLSEKLEQIATQADTDEHNRPKCITKRSFWDAGPQFANALRLFSRVLKSEEAQQFIEPIDYPHSIIKHSLCFRQIVEALNADGRLPSDSRLTSWNMWRGMDLLQAIDLIFLNHLANNGREKGKERSKVNRLRRSLWEGINVIITASVGTDVEKRRQCTPTRRGETSGFVIRK